MKRLVFMWCVCIGIVASVGLGAVLVRHPARKHDRVPIAFSDRFVAIPQEGDVNLVIKTGRCVTYRGQPICALDPQKIMCQYGNLWWLDPERCDNGPSR
jgi:hypothetical protein